MIRTLVVALLVVSAGCAGTTGSDQPGQSTPELTPTTSPTDSPTPTPSPTPTSTPTPADSDGDGLSDREEAEYGTNPDAADTDGDGMTDRIEIGKGTDPTAEDTDGDGIPDGREKVLRTDPTAKDTDGDGLADADDECPTKNGVLRLQITFLSASNADTAFIDASDPYVRVESGDRSTQSDFFDNPSEITDPFSITIDVPDGKNSHPLRVSVWDEDTHWEPSDTDDQLDIVGDSPDELAWTTTVMFTGTESTNIHTEGGGDSEDDVDANMDFTLTVEC